MQDSEKRSPNAETSPDEPVARPTEGASQDGGTAQPATSPDADHNNEDRKLDRALLEFLVCPLRKTTLIYDAEKAELISPVADLAYPIRDGVPLLTEETARPLNDDDRRRHRIR
ncbi:MAG: Trm112 family protein [Pseudomonadota bacterium]